MISLSTTTDWLQSLGSLFYPHLCAGCGNNILSADQSICHRCIAQFPATGFAQQNGNPVEKLFWGRIPVSAACSGFYFTRSSTMQHVLHALKYKDHKDAGRVMGRLMGHLLQQSNRFSNIDVIVPLPLFPDKEIRRGYNQAAIIAEGIQEVLQVPMISDAICRNRYTESQTHKNRIERWENVGGVFSLKDPAKIRQKKILLVDDVVTTGASLEACGSAILQGGIESLYIATVAFADQ